MDVVIMFHTARGVGSIDLDTVPQQALINYNVIRQGVPRGRWLTLVRRYSGSNLHTGIEVCCLRLPYIWLVRIFVEMKPSRILS